MMIGDKIKVLLDRRGMTQRELAKRIGITEVSMSRYINNSRVPKGPLVAAMAKALGVSADELLGLAEGPVIRDDKPPLSHPETHEERTETHACDLISRAAILDIVLEYAQRLYEPVGTREDNEMYSFGRGLLLGIERNLRELPSAQPEHIKCRDCKEYSTHDHRCRWWNHGTNEAGWCYAAERREK